MVQMQQYVESKNLEDFEQKLEKAKKIYFLLNEFTFGNNKNSSVKLNNFKR